VRRSLGVALLIGSNLLLGGCSSLEWRAPRELSPEERARAEDARLDAQSRCPGREAEVRAGRDGTTPGDYDCKPARK